MSRDLGNSPGTPAPPPATRVARPGWRDPRLWLGVLLVAGSVVLGARLLAAADDTVAVWAVVDDRGSGTPVVAADLAVERVRFGDGDVLDRYFPADQPVPDGLVLTRAVGAGELLARSAVGDAERTDVLQVPLAVDPQRVPPDVAAGSVVDVWISDGTADRDRARDDDATAGTDGPALSGVTVVAAPGYDDTFAVSGTRQVVVAVDDERAAAFEQLLSGLGDPVIRILQRS
ncbi:MULTISPECIES: hypothetical protein [unclassified Nocardioides]|uniref:hypothetical protein n=1 Tax=unclassified Nocardioides TaxID=2615069 RepID=UPI0012F97E6F|nr:MULTISPECIES: hypothetical protein [unclassified Nocardioides]